MKISEDVSALTGETFGDVRMLSVSLTQQPFTKNVLCACMVLASFRRNRNA